MSLFLHIFDYFRHRRVRLWLLLVAVVALLCASATRIGYKEDISDFMPFDANYRKAMQVYQEVAAGNRVVLVFSMADTTRTDRAYIAQGVSRFGEVLAQCDTAGWVSDWQPEIDESQVLDVFSFVYEHLPYYLDEADYARLDSLLTTDPDFLRHRLQTCYEQIGSMAGSFLQPMIQNDPLGLGGRVTSLLRQYQPELKFDRYDGLIFTPDGRRCLVSITSPFGNSETDGNSRLVRLLEQVRSQVQAQPGNEELEVGLVGAPVIAVSNAAQIKSDSMLALIISSCLILALLLLSFRSFGALVHIALATSFGFLFALGLLGLMLDTLSVIVLGIASVIIGIAVNYPLHFLCHMQQEPNPRTTLRELVTPLFIGNVTTVGAFLTLVPLDAVAVRDLGLFSALMLVGTIIFVLVFMPHLPLGKLSIGHHTAPTSQPTDSQLSRSARGGWVFGSPFLVLLLLSITALLGWFSLDTQFDSDLSHLNYMTPQQRSDLNYLAQLQGEEQGQTVFLSVESGSFDQALQTMEQINCQARSKGIDTLWLSASNPVALLPSTQLQQHRLNLWHDFWQRHGYGQGLTADFHREAAAVGFAPDAFAPFESLLTSSAQLLSQADFLPLTSTILTGMVGEGQLVAKYQVPVGCVAEVEEQLGSILPTGAEAECHVFDLASLNRRVSDALSSNFNYIGLACSCIVFLFLWFSFRRLELAIIAFLPMVIGWVWILGLMELCGIQFNIVNIILASFIFGQGDDYTIFVTEGLVREYREGRRILVGYQRSILLSALIMLIGIGSLIVAQHPAMHSLAEVTIIGMAVVVLMAWFIPPLAFRWFIRYDGSLRRYLDSNH